MAVYVGDAEAKDFGMKTTPFNTDPGRAGKWNSLFIKNATTVTAVSGTTIDGISGLWAIDGQLISTGAKRLTARSRDLHCRASQ